MKLEEATKLGLDFAEKRGEVITGVKFGISNPVEYESCFYFDFCLRTLDNKIPEEEIYIGGAPGFTIDKNTKEIKSISWQTLSELMAKK